MAMCGSRLVLAFALSCLTLLSLPAADDPVHAVSQALARYSDLPKGVVLEGNAAGFEQLSTVDYDKEKDEFVINGKARFKNPIGKKDFVKVFRSLQKDDRMGVTLREGEPKLYGSLDRSSKFVDAMVETDKLLGGIVYGIERLLEGVKLPGDYKPAQAKERKVVVVAFTRFTDFVFEKQKDGSYARVSCNLDIQLIPLAEKKTETGGHLPDMEKMPEYVPEESDSANVSHIKSNQLEYFKLPMFAHTVAAGEAAAFARLIRDTKGLDPELLLKQMK